VRLLIVIGACDARVAGPGDLPQVVLTYVNRQSHSVPFVLVIHRQTFASLCQLGEGINKGVDTVLSIPFGLGPCRTAPICGSLAVHKRGIVSDRTHQRKWFEPEVNRIAGEIALKSPKPEAAEANTFFERALTVARDQGAKSWELRAAR
jgi:hypothetical protein